MAIEASDAADSAKAGTSSATTLDGLEVKGVAGYRAERVASPKFTQSLQDTPQTIQVITSDLFNQQGASTLTEALRNSPGVGTFYAGENGNTATGDTVYMRGFDSSSSIFVDGIRDVGAISRDVFNIDQGRSDQGSGRHRQRPHLAQRRHQPGQQAGRPYRFHQRDGLRRHRGLRARHRGLEPAARRRQRVAVECDVAGQRRARPRPRQQQPLGPGPSLAFGL